MEIIYTICFFILGTILGSFYNVVGYRLPKGESLIKPSSHCPSCNHKLKWYELIPIISYLIQGGKCRNCKEKINIFYPLIELLTGALFGLSFYLFGFSYNFVIMLITTSVFSIVLVSDINYLLIPDEVTIIASSIMIVINFIMLELKDAIFMFLSGVFLFILMFLVMKLGNYLFKKESLGGADIKLMFLVGLILRPIEGIFCIFLASVLALPISTIKILKDKNNIIPFGPFIVLALIIIILCGINSNTLLNIW